MSTQSAGSRRTSKQPFMAALLLMLAFTMFMTMGCGIANALLGGQTSGTVDDLWADVPRLDGLTKTKLDLPLSTRLIIKTAVKATMGNDGGNFDFIAFTTGKTPKEAMDFYTTQRMTEAGWNNTGVPGCTGDASSGATQGLLCIFGKQAGKEGTLLVIVVAQDDSNKQTQLFYVRMAANNLTGTPNS
jgi:hypothetical protein